MLPFSYVAPSKSFMGTQLGNITKWVSISYVFLVSFGYMDFLNEGKKSVWVWLLDT